MWCVKGVYDCADLESKLNKFDSVQFNEHLVEFSAISYSEEACLDEIKNHIINNVFGTFSKSRLKITLSEEVKSQVFWYEDSHTDNL